MLELSNCFTAGDVRNYRNLFQLVVKTHLLSSLVLLLSYPRSQGRPSRGPFHCTHCLAVALSEGVDLSLFGCDSPRYIGCGVSRDGLATRAQT